MTAFLEIFLYLKNSNSVEKCIKVLLIMLFIYSQGKIKLSHCIWSIRLFWILFCFSSALLLSKIKLLFFSPWKFEKFFISFLKPQVRFHPNFAFNLRTEDNITPNKTPLYFFSSNIIYLGQKQPIKVQIFVGILECSGQILQIPLRQFWTGKSIPVQILHHSSFSWLVTPL